MATTVAMIAVVVMTTADTLVVILVRLVSDIVGMMKKIITVTTDVDTETMVNTPVVIIDIIVIAMAETEIGQSLSVILLLEYM